MRFILPLLFLPFFQTLVAQNAGNPSAKNRTSTEIGLNVTSFVKTFLTFNNDAANPGSYLLSIKTVDLNGKAWRYGAGMFFSNSTSDLTTTDGTRTRDNVNFDLRAGKEWQIQVSKHWFFLAGADVLADYSLDKTETDTEFEFSVIKTRGYSAGFGPFAGVMFKINDRIGLFTEASYYFISGASKTTEKYEEGTQEDEERKSNFNSLSLRMPSNLFFYMRF